MKNKIMGIGKYLEFNTAEAILRGKFKCLYHISLNLKMLWFIR